MCFKSTQVDIEQIQEGLGGDDLSICQIVHPEMILTIVWTYQSFLTLCISILNSLKYDFDYLV